MFADVYRSIVDRWRVLVGVALVVVVVATVIGLAWPDRYTATATVTVEEVATGQGSLPPVNMETQRVVGRSTEVLDVAADELGEASVTVLRSQLEVTVPRGAEVLQFSVTSPSAELSAARANAIAAAYLQHRVARAEGLIDRATETLADSVTELTQQAEALAPDSPVRASLESQISALQDRRATLIATSVDAGSLIDPAVPPSESNGPPLYVFITAGAFLGVFLGAFAALVWDRIRANRRGDRNEAAAEADGATIGESEPQVAARAPAGDRVMTP